MRESESPYVRNPRQHWEKRGDKYESVRMISRIAKKKIFGRKNEVY